MCGEEARETKSCGFAAFKAAMEDTVGVFCEFTRATAAYEAVLLALGAVPRVFASVAAVDVQRGKGLGCSSALFSRSGKFFRIASVPVLTGRATLGAVRSLRMRPVRFFGSL